MTVVIPLLTAVTTPVLDTLAMALFRHGNLGEAVEVQKELLELMDGSDAGGFKVADARAQLARFEAAGKVKEKTDG